MAKVLRVTDGDYKIVVDNGNSAKITLDTTGGNINTPVGTVVVTGDLEVKGVTTTVESTVTTIADNILTLNEGESGTGIRASFDYKAGIEIDRGSLPFARIVFDETVPWNTGGSSGTGAWILEDVNEDQLPLAINTISAQGPLYISTPGSAINVAGTVDYEENIYEYITNPVTLEREIDKTNPNAIKNVDFIPNAKGVADYVNYSLATNFQTQIEDNDTRVTAADYDSTLLESNVEVAIDATVIANFYTNRIELSDIQILDNEISTLTSNRDLRLTAQGQGNVVIDDALVLPEYYYDEDPNLPTLNPPSNGVKLFTTTPGEGDSGLYFINSQSTTDEIITKNRALVFGMLF